MFRIDDRSKPDNQSGDSDDWRQERHRELRRLWRLGSWAYQVNAVVPAGVTGDSGAGDYRRLRPEQSTRDDLSTMTISVQ